MIECIPREEVCPAVTELETALWIETGEKVMQYVDKKNKLERKAELNTALWIEKKEKVMQNVDKKNKLEIKNGGPARSADDDETRDAKSPALTLGCKFFEKIMEGDGLGLLMTRLRGE